MMRSGATIYVGARLAQYSWSGLRGLDACYALAAALCLPFVILEPPRRPIASLAWATARLLPVVCYRRKPFPAIGAVTSATCWNNIVRCNPLDPSAEAPNLRRDTRRRLS